MALALLLETKLLLIGYIYIIHSIRTPIRLSECPISLSDGHITFSDGQILRLTSQRVLSVSQIAYHLSSYHALRAWSECTIRLSEVPSDFYDQVFKWSYQAIRLNEAILGPFNNKALRLRGPYHYQAFSVTYQALRSPYQASIIRLSD
jgi:hypothetical protein